MKTRLGSITAVVLAILLAAGCGGGPGSKPPPIENNQPDPQEAATAPSDTINPWGYAGPWGKPLKLGPVTTEAGYILSATIKFGKPLHDDLPRKMFEPNSSYDSTSDLPPNQYAIPFIITVTQHIDQDSPLPAPSMETGYFAPGEESGYGTPVQTTGSGGTQLYPESGRLGFIAEGHARGDSYNYYGAVGPAKTDIFPRSVIRAEFYTGTTDTGAVGEKLIQLLPNRALPTPVP
jgi:hypothetical protein